MEPAERAIAPMEPERAWASGEAHSSRARGGRGSNLLRVSGEARSQQETLLPVAWPPPVKGRSFSNRLRKSPGAVARAQMGPVARFDAERGQQPTERAQAANDPPRGQPAACLGIDGMTGDFRLWCGGGRHRTAAAGSSPPPGKVVVCLVGPVMYYRRRPPPRWATCALPAR
jgi:hypothetical protein